MISASIKRHFALGFVTLIAMTFIVDVAHRYGLPPFWKWSQKFTRERKVMVDAPGSAVVMLGGIDVPRRARFFVSSSCAGHELTAHWESLKRPWHRTAADPPLPPVVVFVPSQNAVTDPVTGESLYGWKETLDLDWTPDRAIRGMQAAVWVEAPKDGVMWMCY